MKDSIEEKVLELQSKKKDLVQNVISVEEGFSKQLTKQDIENLFA